MTGNSPHYDRDGLSILVDEYGSVVTLRWQGVSDAREPSVNLSPFFSSLLESLSGKQVILDFRQFEYMNSATVSPLIGFVKSLDARGAQTTLVFDSSVPWQKVNSHFMRAIARTLSNVQVQA